MWNAIPLFSIPKKSPLHPATVGMSDIHKSRLTNVSDACRRLGVKPMTIQQMRLTGAFRNMYVDDRRRYVFCRIGKVASTTWSRLLLLVTGQVIVMPVCGLFTIAAN